MAFGISGQSKGIVPSEVAADVCVDTISSSKTIIITLYFMFIFWTYMVFGDCKGYCNNLRSYCQISSERFNDGFTKHVYRNRKGVLG